MRMPYASGHVSMAVHRIGRTVLLDRFDVERLLPPASASAARGPSSSAAATDRSATPPGTTSSDLAWIREVYEQNEDWAHAIPPKKNRQRMADAFMFEKLLRLTSSTAADPARPFTPSSATATTDDDRDSSRASSPTSSGPASSVAIDGRPPRTPVPRAAQRRP